MKTEHSGTFPWASLGGFQPLTLMSAPRAREEFRVKCHENMAIKQNWVERTVPFPSSARRHPAGTGTNGVRGALQEFLSAGVCTDVTVMTVT